MSFVLKYNIYIKVQLLTLIFWGCAPSAPETNSYQADVIVYGGTSAGVIAAVEVAQSGKSVILVTPDKHLGGLTAGGLGWTDTGKKEAIGGLSRDFYHRVWKHYANEDAWVWQKKDEYGGRGQGTRAIDGSKRTMWIFEPFGLPQKDLVIDLTSMLVLFSNLSFNEILDIKKLFLKNRKRVLIKRRLGCSEGWTRTSDLRVMSPTSYLLLYLAM